MNHHSHGFYRLQVVLVNRLVLNLRDLDHTQDSEKRSLAMSNAEFAGVSFLGNIGAPLGFLDEEELDIEETRPELDIVRHAMKELKASSRFRQVLKV